MLDPQLLSILCCPESHQDLKEADASQIQKLNAAIAQNRVQNGQGDLVQEPVEGALVRADAKRAYPIREGIPALLIEEGLNVEGVL